MDGGIRDWREKGYPLTKGKFRSLSSWPSFLAYSTSRIASESQHSLVDAFSAHL